MFVATIVASGALRQGDITQARDRLLQAGCSPDAIIDLEPGKATDILFTENLEAARQTLQAMEGAIDVIVQPLANREKKLLVADMDSTMITVECIDELADYAGIKEQIAEVTERAMRGELDFAEALRSRVALLKGLEDKTIDICRTERVKIMSGARELVRTMTARGAKTILVSGGFTRFAEPVGEEIGFGRVVANILDVECAALVGTVQLPIVDAVTKRDELEQAIAQHGIPRERTMAVGDGANDILMMQAASLGVAYHAKQKARDAADAEINHGDLSVLLYAQGIARTDWVAE